MAHWRTFRLCKLLHCAPGALEDESAAQLDWLLQLADLEAEIQHEMSG